jgi:hypothetical protein
MIAQSMAREYGPFGIHVAHVVIDGGINGDRLRNRVPTLIKERGEDGLLGIDAIAKPSKLTAPARRGRSGAGGDDLPAPDTQLCRARHGETRGLPWALWRQHRGD